MTRRRTAGLAGSVAAAAALVVLGAPPAAAAPFPEVIALPDGYQPEGIATGTGHTFYVGSIPTGAVRVGDYRTGTTDPLVPARSGRAAIGLKYDRGLLWVAGGPTGKAFVYDAATGADVAVYALAGGPTFVNDVVLTKDAAYFTDSVNPVLYRVARDGSGAPGALTTIPLTGDLVYGSGFNVNGIAATPDGGTLFVVQSNTASVFRVDPLTGVTDKVELTDPSGAPPTVPNADGVLLLGRTLYVVQNRLNLVARIDLAPDLGSGVIVSRTRDADFDVPTTIAAFGNALYAVNARFGTASPGTATYAVVRLPRP
jgi:sugar lactone lactonase YvrE